MKMRHSVADDGGGDDGGSDDNDRSDRSDGEDGAGDNEFPPADPDPTPLIQPPDPFVRGQHEPPPDRKVRVEKGPRPRASGQPMLDEDEGEGWETLPAQAIRV
jgi:hypothetical protein